MGSHRLSFVSSGSMVLNCPAAVRLADFHSRLVYAVFIGRGCLLNNPHIAAGQAVAACDFTASVGVATDEMVKVQAGFDFSVALGVLTEKYLSSTF